MRPQIRIMSFILVFCCMPGQAHVVQADVLAPGLGLLGDLLGGGAVRTTPRTKKAASQPSANPAAWQAAVAEVKKQEGQLAAARDAAGKAQVEFDKIVTQLKRDFESSPNWTSAQSELRQAQSEYDAARASVISTLEGSADYAAAKSAKIKAQATRDALDSVENVKDEEKASAAAAVLSAGNAQSFLETSALKQDTNAAQASQKLVAASAKVSQLNKEFEASVKGNALWSSAKQKLDEANKKLAEAENALAAATERQSAAYEQYLTEEKKAEEAQTKANQQRINRSTNRRGR